MRVVSLVPSVTETLSAWGMDPIACTRYCERPDLAHVGGTKNPDISAIVALEPQLVVVDVEENRHEDAHALEAAGVRVLALHVDSIGGLDHQMERLSAAVGIPRSPMITPTVEPIRCRAVTPIWRRPWMTIGPRTYGSTLLASIGVENVFVSADTSYPEVTLAGMAAKTPDVVLVPSEPYGFTDDHLAELSAVAPTLRVDGQDLFWWGVRTPSAIMRLHDSISEFIQR